MAATTCSHVYRLDWLTRAMRNRAIVTVCGDDRFATGTVNGIRLEDGSGRNYLVTMAPAHSAPVEIFVRAS